VLELVLQIEKQDTDRGREHRDWQMHEQERTDAASHIIDDSRDAGIGRHRAQPGLPVLLSEAFQVRLASIWMSGIGPTRTRRPLGRRVRLLREICRADEVSGTAHFDPLRKPHLLVARRDILPDVGAAPARAFLLKGAVATSHCG
jgi:hypothetical protein